MSLHFGATLRLLRHTSGLSLRDLARQVGVSSAYLSRVEHGLDAAPTPARLHDLAQALGLPPRLVLDLAHRVSPLVVQYVEQVPDAGSLFLEIAHRQLDAEQVAEVRRFVRQRFSPAGERLAGRDDARGPSGGIGSLAAILTPARIVLRFGGTELGDVLDVAAGRLGLPGPQQIATALRRREAELASTLGAGVAMPALHLTGHPERAVLVVLDPPLPTSTPDQEPLGVVVIVVGEAPARERMVRLARIAALAERGLAAALRPLESPEAVLARLGQLEAQLG